jgi:hypothetical protein
MGRLHSSTDFFPSNIYELARKLGRAIPVIRWDKDDSDAAMYIHSLYQNFGERYY